MIQNEKLEAFKIRVQTDITNLERQITTDAINLEKLMHELDKFTNILEHSEGDLKSSTHEGIFIETELRSIRFKLEKQIRQKVALEEKIFELLQEQITTDNAGQLRAKLLRDTQIQRRNVEIGLSSTENQLSEVLLDLETWKSIVTKLKKDVAKFESEKEFSDKTFNSIIEEINATRSSINVKYRTTDLLNQQLKSLINEADGQEISPDEFKAYSLQKDIMDIEVKIRETQNFWIRMQGNLVSMTEKRSSQMNEINIARKRKST